MVRIGDKPILWHIMKTYSQYGFNEFVVCLGYKGYAIKEWFSNYFLHNSDVTIDLRNNGIEIHDNKAEPWKVTLVETGLHTMTGGRIRRVQKYVGNEPFMLTYGDGVSDININDLVTHHKESGKLLTVSAYMPRAKFGALEIREDGIVNSFTEKPKTNDVWVNAGYFVCQPEVFNYLNDGDSTVFECKPLETLAQQGEMNSFKHTGFWKPMDTLRDNTELNEMWNTNNAPWKVWHE
jgi:glucose-1-phosphate cytidylyltransferase